MSALASDLESPASRRVSSRKRFIFVGSALFTSVTRAESFPRASQQGTFVVRHPGSGRDPSVTITTESVEEHEALDALLLTGALLVQHVDVDSDGVGRQFAGVVTGSARYSPVAPGEGVWDVSFDLTVED